MISSDEAERPAWICDSDADTIWMSRIAMNIPNTMKMNAASRLAVKCASDGAGRDHRPRRAPPAARLATEERPRRSRLGGRLADAVRGRARRAASASARSGSRVWTVATTERPGRSGVALRTSSGKVTRTATRCTTLVKLPVALSGGRSENCAPEAGEIDETTPWIVLPPSASMATSTFCPGLMPSSWVSLKLAST